MGSAIATAKSNVVAVIAIVWCAFQLYTGFFGVMSPLVQRGVHAGFALTLIFLTTPISKNLDRDKIYADQIIWVLLSVFALSYMVVNNMQVLLNTGRYTDIERVCAVIIIVCVMEACRRLLGWSIVIIAFVFMLYAYIGRYMPGLIQHPGFNWTRIVTRIGWSIEGIFGICADCSATFIFLFIFYAKMLEKSGGGKVFIDLAMAVVGHVRGGPAKVAVVASCLFGSISGSPVANVVGTGTFTIPLMKSIGYRPAFAGAVEAVASTGGQFMPPVMGASAFLIAEVLGMSYWSVAACALIPALLYYLALFLMVDLEAARIGLSGISRSELPKVGNIVKTGWPALISPVVLIFLLAVMQWSPSKAVVWAISVTFVTCQFSKETRLGPKKLLGAMRDGSLAALETASACLTIGVIVACISLTGLALKLSTVLITLAGGHLLLLLFVTMIACIIFGMGLPTIACYMVLAMMVAPAVVQMGIEPIAAHLFLFYFGIISNITPPVALASYVAAGIAGAKFWPTGLTACKLAVTAFIVPFLFVYNPALVMQGDILEIIQCSITAFCGVWALSIALQNYFIGKLCILQRLIFLAAGITLMIPETITDLVGLALFIAVGTVHYTLNKRQTQRTVVPTS